MQPSASLDNLELTRNARTQDVVLGTRMTREEASTKRNGKKALPHTDGRDPLVQKLAKGEVEETPDGRLKME